MPTERRAMASTALHHIALACRDPLATHHFYADVLGLTLTHTETQEGPKGERVTHFFYDLGDGSLLGFFDLHGVGEPEGFDAAISTGLGLPLWVNHFAIRRDAADLPVIKEQLSGLGIEPTMEADHGWCTSIYYTDPNGILIEFCADTPGVDPDPVEAARVLFDATRGTTSPVA
jgi:catechol 2,3-dioxygenase-like lactoylglutathione lyase family enzyme